MIAGRPQIPVNTLEQIDRFGVRRPKQVSCNELQVLEWFRQGRQDSEVPDAWHFPLLRVSLLLANTNSLSLKSDCTFAHNLIDQSILWLNRKKAGQLTGFRLFTG